MKKMFFQIRQKITAISLILLLFASFVRMSHSSFISLESMSIENISSKDSATIVENRKNPNQKKEWRKYEYYYCLYATSTGDTIPVAPGEKVILPDSVKCYSMLKVMDNWMLQDPKWSHLYYGDWTISTRLPVEPTQKRYITLKLSDYKKVNRLTLAAVPFVTKRKGEDHFNEMRSVSKGVDQEIETQLSERKIALSAATELFKKRKGKPKLRPLLVCQSHQLFSDDECDVRLCAASEANTLSLYASNWVIDSKSVGITSSNLTIASMVFQDIAYNFILPLAHHQTLLHGLQQSNNRSFQGQIIDTQILLSKNQEIVSNYESMMRLYLERCELLNTPYGFSLWSGAVYANASKKDAQQLYQAGLYLGTGLQMINDLEDALHGKSVDRELGKVTLPIWLVDHGIPLAEVQKKISEETQQQYLLACNAVMNVVNATEEKKKALCASFNILLTNKILTATV